MPLTADRYELDENENAPDAAATAIEGIESIPSRKKI